MNEEYAVIGCVHTLEQRNTWKRGLGIDHLPDHESFDVEFSPTGQVILETNYTCAADRYGSTCFVYDDAGKLIRTIEFDEADTEKAISEFEYSEGRRVCTSRDGTGIVSRRTVEEYVGTSRTFLRMYDASGQPILMKSFEYNEGKLFREFAKHYGPEGDFYEISITNFDSLGRAVEAFGLTSDGRPNGDGRYVFEYDEAGRRLRVLSYNDLADTDVPTQIKNFAYKCDEYGNWVERNESYRSGLDSDWTKHKTTRRLTYYSLS